MNKVLIINGPNLNLLGKRETEIYGDKPFEEYFHALQTKHSDFNLEYYQTNWEGAIIDRLQEVGYTYQGIILNAAGYSHTSISIMDCIKAITTPVVEVHISNIYEREEFRHFSYVEQVAAHSIVGRGLKGYDEALTWLKDNT